MKRSPLWWKAGSGGRWSAVYWSICHPQLRSETHNLQNKTCISILYFHLYLSIAIGHKRNTILLVFVFLFSNCFHFKHCICFPRLNHHQAVAGDHWAGVGVLVAAKEGAWLLRPSRAPEKVALFFTLKTKTTFWGWWLIEWQCLWGLLDQMCYQIWFPRNTWWLPWI